MIELQHIYLAEQFNVQSGLGYLNSDETFTSRIAFPFESLYEEDIDADHTSIYSYGQIDMPHSIQATLGFSGDALESPTKDRKEVNPKLGITWQPLRLPWFGRQSSKQWQEDLLMDKPLNLPLLPASINFSTTLKLRLYWTYGVGIDQTFSADWYGGIEFFRRDIDVPWMDINLTGDFEPKEDDWKEDTGSAYLYWAPSDWLTLGLDITMNICPMINFQGAKGNIQPDHPQGQSAHSIFSSVWCECETPGHYIDQKGEFDPNFTSRTRVAISFW